MGQVLYGIRKKVWKAIRDQKTAKGQPCPFDSARIAKIAKSGIPRVNNYIRLLNKAQIIKCINPDDHKNIRRLYILVKNTGTAPPDLSRTGEIRLPSQNQKTWLAIKVLKVFTIRDVTLATGGDSSNTGKYLSLLEQAGYVKTIHKGKGFSGETKYTFVTSKDTGPQAPILQDNESLYDRNTGKVVWKRAAA